MGKVHWTALDRMVERWAHDYGLERAEGRVCLKRVWGEECQGSIVSQWEGDNAVCNVYEHGVESFDHRRYYDWDHPSLWVVPKPEYDPMNIAGQLYFVSLPDSLDAKYLDDLLRLCRVHELTLTISTLTQNNQSCLLVCITRYQHAKP